MRIKLNRTGPVYAPTGAYTGRGGYRPLGSPPGAARQGRPRIAAGRGVKAC